MNKLIASLALMFVSVVCIQAAYTDGYYDTMDGTKKETLKAAAKACVETHKRLSYSELPNYWIYSDVYPELVDGNKRWWDMYSDNIFLIYPDQTGKTSFSANKMQREHAVPKSWWKKDGDVEYTPAYSDMWNLYPSDGPANQAKLNYPFGICKSATFDNGVTKVGPAETGYGGGSGKVFEPGDEYKGDFARAIFYMAVVYDDLPWVVNYMFSADSPYPTLRPWAVDMLLDWARRDPVSQKEIDRNNSVETSQGNRNPFIDFPELAEYIWGTRMEQVFYIADQGGQVTPPVTGDPEIIAPVNGEALDFGEVAVGQSINAQLSVRGANLTSDLSVLVTGKDRSMFKVSTRTIPLHNINLGESYVLDIIYTPTEEGVHEASLTLYDGGLSIEHQVSVSLIGQAFPVPTLETLVATTATNITDTSYQANWNATSQVIDYYVVNRVRYVGDDMESEELNSDTNSLTVTGREPDVMETYSVQSSRLGYLSEPSNVIVVGTSGISGVIDAQPLRIGNIQGGFVVMLDETHTGMTVYDMTGKTVLYAPEISGGETFTLPTGIYMVKDDATARPVKLIVY